jgi:hypothetical protein
MKDNERYRLLSGPYKAPPCKVGNRLHCKIHGWVIVTGFSKGPIRWPLVALGGQSSYILCGDLIRAVQDEATQAVAHWWGVSTGSVASWRKALGVDQCNEGTRQLRSRIAEQRRGKPFSEETRQKMSATAKAKGTRPPWLNPAWSPEEDALLGRIPDEEIARRTRRTRQAIYMRRHKLGIPAPHTERNWSPLTKRNWSAAEDDLLQTVPVKEVARRTGRSQGAVYQRRYVLGLPQFGPYRWTEEEDALLEELSNAEVARQTGRDLKSIYYRRTYLGIPTPNPKQGRLMMKRKK